jgi:hypothetical protein
MKMEDFDFFTDMWGDDSSKKVDQLKKEPVEIVVEEVTPPVVESIPEPIFDPEESKEKVVTEITEETSESETSVIEEQPAKVTEQLQEPAGEQEVIEEESKSEPETEPEKPKRRKRRTKEEIEAEKAAQASSDSSDVEENKKDDTKVQQIKTNVSSVDYDSIMEKFIPVLESEKWTQARDLIQEKFDKIKLEPDINLGSLKFTLSAIAELYPMIRQLRGEYSVILDRLTNKLTGLIPRQQILNSDGSNVDLRKKKAYEAVEKIKIPGIRGEINFYDVEMITKQRLEWLQCKEDSLNKLHQCTIGYLSIFKLMERDS